MSREAGQPTVTAITVPVNTGSIAFSAAMGVRVRPGNAEQDVLLHQGCEGAGTGHVVFHREI